MPIVCAGLAKGKDMNVSHKDGGYDNRNPRDWLEKQQGFKRWAQAAQENCWEALPFFAAAVIVSHMLGVIGWLPNAMAIAFIVLRAGFSEAKLEEALCAHVAESLSSYKQPREIRFVSSIPRNPSGKILRKDLRAQF